MPLYKLADFDPNYKETFDGADVKALDLYTEGGTRVGSVDDVLVDDDGRFRYLVINTALAGTGKNILLPIGLSHIDYNAKRVFVDGLSKEQVEHLPEYRDSMVVDYDYEEKVRGAYRPKSNNDIRYDRNTYNYQQDANLYDLTARDNQTFKLYEERLVAKTNRIKTGEVTVGKHVETETATVSVPLEKERVVIERVTPASSQAVVSNELQFQEGEVARIEVYEETPDIRKEAFVREEVRIKKVVDHETVEARETIRREELDIDAEGNLRMNETNPNTNERI